MEITKICWSHLKVACSGKRNLSTIILGVLLIPVGLLLTARCASAGEVTPAAVDVFLKQLAGVVVIGAYAFGGTWVLGKLVQLMIGIRVPADEEVVGLDISQHGERAYGGILP